MEVLDKLVGKRPGRSLFEGEHEAALKDVQDATPVRPVVPVSMQPVVDQNAPLADIADSEGASLRAEAARKKRVQAGIT